MEIRITIRTREPLSGTAAAGSAGPVPFEGWLELLHALSSLIGGTGPAARPEIQEGRPCEG
jgi:hypothetical protein